MNQPSDIIQSNIEGLEAAARMAKERPLDFLGGVIFAGPYLGMCLSVQTVRIISKACSHE